MSDQIFGAGLAQPLALDGAGRLVVSSGEARLWESITTILETPRGACPLDPDFGLDLVAYDPVSEPERVGWAIAHAIERSEPRVEALEVEILDDDPARGALKLRLHVTPRGARTPISRIFPFFSLPTSG